MTSLNAFWLLWCLYWSYTLGTSTQVLRSNGKAEVLMLYWAISHCMIKVWQRCDFQSVAAISLRSFVTYYNGSFTFYHNFCHRKSLRVYHGNDMMDNVFSLGGIVLLCCCGRASTTTCYCQYIHNMLLWTCKKYCCCTYNIYEITPIYYIHESSRSRYIQVELGKVEGFWSMLQLLQQALAENLKVKHQAHWLPIRKETIQLCHVIMSLCQIEFEHIRLRHLEFHDRPLDLFIYYITICISG